MCVLCVVCVYVVSCVYGQGRLTVSHSVGQVRAGLPGKGEISGHSSFFPFCDLRDRLVGLVVKASASRAEGPGFESRLRRDFFRGRVIPVT